MAVAPTGAIYKSLEFDGVSSRDFGIYITGSAVYNAPERDVEMVSIPGRNGAYALDNGRFQNIEVSYPAGVFADSEADFAEAISNFRNYLCSKRGYVRLEDDYNPDEYRMAIYKSGLEVTPAQLRAGEFEIVFECMPQRWLKSGETEYSVESGGTLNNPTYFDAKPMLLVTGYGDLSIGGETVTVTNTVLGTITLGDSRYFSTSGRTGTLEAHFTSASSKLNTGDAIYETDETRPEVQLLFRYTGSSSLKGVINSTTNCTAAYKTVNTRAFYIYVHPTLSDFSMGTSLTQNATTSVIMTLDESTYKVTITVTMRYDGDDTLRLQYVVSDNLPSGVVVSTAEMRLPAYYADSTLSLLPDPIYLDFDIGEAYGSVADEIMSVDNLVSMPAELPVLSSGDNVITYDNTVSKLKVIPRWWKV